MDNLTHIAFHSPNQKKGIVRGVGYVVERKGELYSRGMGLPGSASTRGFYDYIARKGYAYMFGWPVPIDEDEGVFTLPNGGFFIARKSDVRVRTSEVPSRIRTLNLPPRELK